MLARFIKTAIAELSVFGLFIGLFVFASSLAVAGDTVHGSQLYSVHCAGCHGAAGISNIPGTPSFARQENFLQPGAAEFAAGEELLFLPDTELLARIKRGKAGMPAYQGIISDLDILDIVVFLRTLH